MRLHARSAVVIVVAYIPSVQAGSGTVRQPSNAPASRDGRGLHAHRARVPQPSWSPSVAVAAAAPPASPQRRPASGDQLSQSSRCSGCRQQPFPNAGKVAALQGRHRRAWRGVHHSGRHRLQPLRRRREGRRQSRRPSSVLLKNELSTQWDPRGAHRRPRRRANPLPNRGRRHGALSGAPSRAAVASELLMLPGETKSRSTSTMTPPFVIRQGGLQRGPAPARPVEGLGPGRGAPAAARRQRAGQRGPPAPPAAPTPRAVPRPVLWVIAGLLGAILVARSRARVQEEDVMKVRIVAQCGRVRPCLARPRRTRRDTARPCHGSRRHTTSREEARATGERRPDDGRRGRTRAMGAPAAAHQQVNDAMADAQTMMEGHNALTDLDRQLDDAARSARPRDAELPVPAVRAGRTARTATRAPTRNSRVRGSCWRGPVRSSTPPTGSPPPRRRWATTSRRPRARPPSSGRRRSPASPRSLGQFDSIVQPEDRRHARRAPAGAPGGRRVRSPVLPQP